MRESGRIETTDQVARILLEKRRANPKKNLIIGVAGTVASGKSRFSRYLIDVIREVLGLKILNCPFDYWINSAMLHAPVYAQRFFLEEFRDALCSINAGEYWMCPRYDLLKIGYDQNLWPLILNSTEASWRKRRFVNVSLVHEIPDIEGGHGIYLEPETKRFFSLLLPKADTVYLMDGTMIFHELVTKVFSYDAKIYVSSSWVNRVARMMRRFNRREVFGNTSATEIEYVGFLVREAAACADVEIEAQIDDQTIVLRSKTETISNLLDVCYLKDRLLKYPALADIYMLDLQLVEEAIEETYVDFSSITNSGHLRSLKIEFSNLVESRHLLVINNMEVILQRLRSVLRL